MTRKGENEPSLAPFLAKCYEMVDDETSDGIICWTQSNDSFVVLNMTEFTRDLLPKYFKHCNFSSFMRQLNIYGFRKADTDRWEFANDRFIKGRRHLLKEIKRRKNILGSSQKNSQLDQPIDVSDAVDYVSLEKEVEILKTDKKALMQELSILRERQESSQDKLLLLRERLQGMENNQQQLLSFLVMVMQSPGLLVQLLQPKESSWRVTEADTFTLDQVTECESSDVADGLIVRYQPMSDGAPSTLSSLADSDKQFEQDLSFDGIEDFFMNFSLPSSPADESLASPKKLELEELARLLLGSPSRDCAEETHFDDEQTLVSEMEMRQTLCSTQLEDFEQTYSALCSKGIDEPTSVDVLTEKMGSLSPGRKLVESVGIR